MVPSSSIMEFISSPEASPIWSQIWFIFSSISNKKEKALFNTSRMVMPFSRTVCWSRYPTRTFFAHSTFPSSGMQLTGDDAHEGGFPLSVGPDEADVLAL